MTLGAGWTAAARGDGMGGNALGVPAAVHSLTAREREVLALVGEGLTNAEIAERLFLAETTAKTHVHRVMGKLQARDRVQAALIANRAGLV